MYQLDKASTAPSDRSANANSSNPRSPSSPSSPSTSASMEMPPPVAATLANSSGGSSDGSAVPLFSLAPLTMLSSTGTPPRGEGAVARIDTPLFHTVFDSSSLKAIAELFRAKGYGLRIVGGAVRDLLLDKPPKDIDLATDALPTVVSTLLSEAGIRVIPTGLQHGTITAVLEKDVYEITTLRIDRVTDGRHAQVDFTTSWKLDAERRDLTYNAMSIDMDGVIYDYFGGLHDLGIGKTAFVGDAELRIQEDYLRILRYFRFLGRMSDTLGEDKVVTEHATLAAIKKHAGGLQHISGERIWLEMSKILGLKSAPFLIRAMNECQVTSCIQLTDVFQDPGTFAEFCRVCSVAQDAITRLVALCASQQSCQHVCDQWKLSNVQKHFAVFISEHRQNPVFANLPPAAGSAVNESALRLAQDFLVDKVPRQLLIELLLYHELWATAEHLKTWKEPIFSLSGKTLSSLGIPPGKHMGEIIKTVRDEWKKSRFAMSPAEQQQLALRVFEEIGQRR